MDLINFRCELYPPTLKGFFSADNWISQSNFYFQFQHLHNDVWVYQVASHTSADDYNGASLEVSCIVHFMYKGNRPQLDEALELAHKAVQLMNENINREILPRVKLDEQNIITPFKDEDVVDEIITALSEAYS
jgi:hypothetical protein